MRRIELRKLFIIKKNLERKKILAMLGLEFRALVPKTTIVTFGY